MRNARRFVHAFTLVELLVVISIIALLVAILLPSLTHARKQAKAVICQTRLRSLSTAAFTYMTEYGVLPPSVSNYAESNTSSMKALHTKSGLDWLGIGDQKGNKIIEGPLGQPELSDPEGFTDAPKLGKLWPYTKDEDAYLCPSDKRGVYDPNSPTGGGGNGKFSYTIFANLGLRNPENIPTRLAAKLGGSRGGPDVLLSKRAFAKIPLFVEEHPEGINHSHVEGNFNYGLDMVVSRHVPYSKRQGRLPGSDDVVSFKQGTTMIGFIDGHVEGLQVNQGITRADIEPPQGKYPDLIPDTANGLMYYYGINDSIYIDIATGKNVVVD